MQKNAYFRLGIEDDGLYIILYPPELDGLALEYSEVQKYLKTLPSTSINTSGLAQTLESLSLKTALWLSTEPIPHVDESLITYVSPDKMTASVRFHAASEEGEQLSKDDILERLSKAGIVHGIDETAIDNWLENRLYCTDILIAEGTPPEDSRDSFIDYNFETKKVFRPTVEHDGSINFHQLNLFNNVSQDDVIAVLTPAYHGEPGKNVLGISLPARNPQKKTLKYGKNVRISEDSLILVAAVSGHVELENERVFVENVYSIKGNVGPATGDVDFDGIVRISGDVLSGYSVTATSDIIIEGVVEGATITAGGNIVVANGVHGGARANISAEGDITVKFIQESEVFSDGGIYTGSILYSKVKAGGCIEVVSGKGLVKGGELRARTSIKVKTVGSPFAGANTQLEVGASPEETDKFRMLEEELAGKRANQIKVRQAMKFLKRKIEMGDPLKPDQEKLMAALPQQMEMLDTSIASMFQKYLTMKDRLMQSTSGKIVIEETIYDGAKLIISGVAYYVHEDLAQCQFEKKGVEIHVGPLSDNY